MLTRGVKRRLPKLNLPFTCLTAVFSLETHSTRNVATTLSCPRSPSRAETGRFSLPLALEARWPSSSFSSAEGTSGSPRKYPSEVRQAPKRSARAQHSSGHIVKLRQRRARHTIGIIPSITTPCRRMDRVLARQLVHSCEPLDPITPGLSTRFLRGSVSGAGSHALRV